MPLTSIIGPPFLVRGAREGIGHALIFEGSLKDASPAVRRDFYVVLEVRKSPSLASGAPPKRTRRVLEADRHFLKSSDLEGSIINGPKEGEKEPQLCA